MERKITHQKNLGAFIHDARTKSGLTQQELALQAGVSRKWLIGIEQGERPRAELNKVLDVLRALGIDLTLSWTASGEPAGIPEKSMVYAPDIFTANHQLNHLFGETKLQQQVRSTLEDSRKS